MDKGRASKSACDSPGSSSDELPDTGYLNRQKKQLAAAQRRWSHGDATRARGSENGGHSSPYTQHSSLNVDHKVPLSDLAKRRVSWRDAHAQYVDTIPPPTDWSKQRRPSWRQSAADTWQPEEESQVEADHSSFQQALDERGQSSAGSNEREWAYRERITVGCSETTKGTLKVGNKAASSENDDEKESGNAAVVLGQSEEKRTVSEVSRPLKDRTVLQVMGREVQREPSVEESDKDGTKKSARRRLSSIRELKEVALAELKSRRSRRHSDSEVSDQSGKKKAVKEQGQHESIQELEEASVLGDKRARQLGSWRSSNVPAGCKLEGPLSYEGGGASLCEWSEEHSKEAEQDVHKREEQREVAAETDQAKHPKVQRRMSLGVLKGDWLAKARAIGVHEATESHSNSAQQGRFELGACRIEVIKGVEGTHTSHPEVKAKTVKQAVEGAAKSSMRDRGSEAQLRVAENPKGFPEVEAHLKAGNPGMEESIPGERESNSSPNEQESSAQDAEHVHKPAYDQVQVQEHIRTEVDLAVKTAIASCHANLLDRTRSTISFEMIRVWDDVRQAKAQLKESAKLQNQIGAPSVSVGTGAEAEKTLKQLKEELQAEIEGLRREVERTRKELTAGSRDMRKADKSPAEGAIAGLRDEVQRAVLDVREALEGMPTKGGRSQEEEDSRQWSKHAEETERELLLRLEKSESMQKKEMGMLRKQMSELERNFKGFSVSGHTQVGDISLAVRTQQIEETLAKMQHEVSELLKGVADLTDRVSKSDEASYQSEQNVKELGRTVQSIQMQAEEKVSSDADFFGRLDMLRRDLEQGLAKAKASMVLRLETVEKEARAGAQKLRTLQGRDLLEDLAEGLPSPAARKAEAVASASKRTEDQLAKVEERIGLMLGLVSKGEDKDEPSPFIDTAQSDRTVPDSKLLLDLIGRLESVERKTSGTSWSTEGLLQRLAALEASLNQLQTTRSGEDTKLNEAEKILQERLQESLESARAQKVACLEARLTSVERLVLSASGTVLSPKPSNPLSPCFLSPGLLSPKTPKPDAKVQPRLKAMSNFEKRLGGLEARLDALASNEASSLAEVRARVQGLDKRVHGLHRHVDLEAQLSKRVATAEWRLEQIASLVIANTRALEAQLVRAQEDSTLAKDAADLAAGKCSALAAEVVKLNKQLTAVTNEKRTLLGPDAPDGEVRERPMLITARC